MLNLPEYILLIPAVVIGIYVAWSDMKYMRIPNISCLILFVSFLILGFLIFDLSEYGFRILQGFVFLAIGFVATSIGAVGGGDSKYAAALAPFVAFSDIPFFIVILAVMSFLSVGLHKIAGVTPGIKTHVQDWVSWKRRGVFPFGLTLSASIIAYLVIVNFYS